MTDHAASLVIPPLQVGPVTLASRLILGTGKYADFATMNRCLDISGCDCVTVAVRRVNFDGRPEDNLLNHLDTKRYKVLPNTAGCFTADDAVRCARLSRELLETDLVKLEVLADKKTLLPDPVGTLEACKILVKEGFTVMVYTSDDPIMARRIADTGVAAVMPAGSPIGSGQGVLNPNAITIILETVRPEFKVPIIVDAGVGTASDITLAMELGADGVLLNTGIAHAKHPERMALAMKHGLEAGYWAARGGRIQRRLYAQASSPWEGVISTIPGE